MRCPFNMGWPARAGAGRSELFCADSIQTFAGAGFVLIARRCATDTDTADQRAADLDRQTTGLNNQTAVHIAQTVIFGRRADKGCQPRGVAPKAGRGECLADAGANRMRASIVSDQNRFGHTTSRNDGNAHVVPMTLGLVHDGFGYGGDDVALLRAGGLCMPLPFAPAVKSGAMCILLSSFPQLGKAPILRRPDRRRVRYLLPDAFVPPPDCTIGWIVLLDRQSGSAARLQRVDAGDALRGLLAGAFAQEGGLTDRSFHLLAGIIGAADVFRLTYSDLQDAIETLGKACR